MRYELTTLDNGLRIASEHLPGVDTISLAISVDVGARYEREEQHGVSHLLEHMAFKGTQKRSALNIAESFDNIGGHLNAYTSHEHTVYYAKILHQNLPLAAEILCDILQNSTFDTEELTKEKHVIMQELAMHHDTPDDLVFDYFQETAFANQPLGRSILGTAESIQKYSSYDIKAFVAKHYHPESIVISAAGHVDHDALVTLINEHLHLDADGAAPIAEVGQYTGGHHVTAKELEQLQLVLGIPAMPITDTRYYTLQLLSTILGGGMSSRLFQEVREKRGLVYTIQSFAACYKDCGALAVYAATGEQEVQELLPVIGEQWHNLSQHIKPEELERAKNQQKANLLMARENSASVAEWIGRHLLQYGEYRSAADIISLINKIRIEDVQTLAKELFTNPNLTVTALGPTQHVMAGDKVQAALAA